MSNKIAHCTYCNKLLDLDRDNFLVVPSPRRGGRNVFACAHCGYELRPYSTDNREWVNTEKVDPATFGIEWESSHSSEKARAEFLQNRYIPTHDCTVDCEYKSPVFQGLKAVSKQAVSFERLMKSGDLANDDDPRISTHTCSTHTHVGMKGIITPVTMGYIRRFYHSLFLALSDEMRRCPDEVNRLFGRNFVYYAAPIDADTDAEEHRNFVNVQHDYTLEFRLVKFRNAKQYMAVVKFAKACAVAICNNFLAHFDDEPTDTKRYPTITAYRRHKAQVAGQKMVKYFHQYAAMAPEADW